MISGRMITGVNLVLRNSGGSLASLCLFSILVMPGPVTMYFLTARVVLARPWSILVHLCTSNAVEYKKKVTGNVD